VELYEILADLLVAYPDHFRKTINAIRRIGDALARELLGTGGDSLASEDGPPASGGTNRSEAVEQHAGGRDESGQADKETDKSKKKLHTIPENPEVVKLAKAIKRGRQERRAKIDVARGFTEGNELKAQSLLRQLRRYPVLLE
jgi:hypothetical protein